MPAPSVHLKIKMAAIKEKCVKQSGKQIERHPFVEPWEDSDLVLKVEDNTFYVHRQILSLHSPVFKAMLSSKFKEGTATEIPLPGKKSNEVLDFLKVLYLKETESIYTLDKMSHLLKLADEYDVQGVLDVCVKCLIDVQKSKENAVKVLYLATDTVIAREDSRLDGVRRDCEIIIEDMDLANITGKSDFKSLNRESIAKVFVKRTKRLETFIKDVKPQLIGLVEYCLHLQLESKKPVITRCPQHFAVSPILGIELPLPYRVKSCSGCRGMIKQLVDSSYNSKKSPSDLLGLVSAGSRDHKYKGCFHFDEKLITILQDINKVVAPPITPFGSSTTSLFGSGFGSSTSSLFGSGFGASTSSCPGFSFGS